MTPWTRRQTLLAGLGLILLTNAVALGGVFRNRTGEPESTLTLSQRELYRPTWGIARESSGILLDLRWRTVPREADGMSGWSVLGGGAPDWLDRAKMAELGFDVGAMDLAGDRLAGRQKSRAVLLVLELDGPARHGFLERVRRHAEDEAKKAAAVPDNADAQRRLKAAREWLEREENHNSRLFAIDAGLDRAALRARYPDRGRHAIVAGRVSPWRSGAGKTAKWAGYVQRVLVSEINLPFEFRQRFEARGRGTPPADDSTAPFTATVAFGQRLEPWLVSLAVPSP